MKNIFSDPLCGEDGIAKDYCGTMKNNSKSKGIMISNWVFLCIGIIVMDILKWFPQVQDLFPSALSYNIANGIVDGLFCIGAVILLGLPGLLSLLKMFDTIVIFWLGAYVPALIPVAFWIEIFPALAISVVIYYMVKPLADITKRMS